MRRRTRTHEACDVRAGGRTRLGALRADGSRRVVELSEPADMLALIDAGDRGLDKVARGGGQAAAGKTHRLDEVELLPPLRRAARQRDRDRTQLPEAREETARIEGREPSPPTIFTKAITSLTEPFDDIAIDPAISDKIDWEVELGVVIGKARREHQRARDALAARLRLHRAQRRHRARHPERLGRPVLQGQEPGSIVPDRAVDRDAATRCRTRRRSSLQLRVNGVVEAGRQHPRHDLPGRRDHRVGVEGHDPAAGIDHRHRHARRRRASRARRPSSCKPGDVMETEVEGIGMLRNKMVPAKVGAARESG